MLECLQLILISLIRFNLESYFTNLTSLRPGYLLAPLYFIYVAGKEKEFISEMFPRDFFIARHFTKKKEKDYKST